MQMRLPVIVCLTAGKVVKVMLTLASEISIHHFLIKLPNHYLSIILKQPKEFQDLKFKFIFISIL